MNNKLLVKYSSQAKTSLELPEKISSLIESCEVNFKSIVLVTGVFDVLHLEHENFLKKAKQLGKVLIIAVESDFRVRQIKGEDRPINFQEERVRNLEKLAIADEIFILPNEFSLSRHHFELIKTIKPEVLAVSSHTAHLDKKRKIMEMVDGKLVVIHEHNPSVSSTKIINGNS